MTRPDPLMRAQVNWAQYDPSQPGGHYESYYLRGNHPERPLAFWIRYTIFSPAGRPERCTRRAVGDRLRRRNRYAHKGQAGVAVR